ncbi:putative nuclease HARBI1 isoform X2 [Solenopsis invicta]|uniref:putative nuclease HARBI1 isoform X2 n=1 Tax=Solenopsis invicta TaxID=13686 RepID=UPI00193D99D1|nr:putative nuclease HARBI1 isoform X2 [Solenopsis invicta]
MVHGQIHIDLYALNLVWEKATALRAVRRVTYALHCLAPRFIKWPREEEATRVIEEFQKAKDFPGVIGAVDGSFIQIRAPQKDAASYICRKNYHAIHLQAVCDARSLFTHCYVGHAGSVHDARVFKNSPLISSKGQMNIFLQILILLEMQHIHFIHIALYRLEIMDTLLQGKRISIIAYHLLAWPLKEPLDF